jgi:sugar-phosphatase
MWPIDALLLDMDGTLVDSDAAVDRAWVTWAGEFGLEVGELAAFLRTSGHP